MAREQRRLAAIVAADVVGYSRLMEQDENGTLAELRAHRAERIEPALARNGGRVIKLAGDGSLIEFASAVDALRATIEFQQAIAEANADKPEAVRLVFRVGLHLGDLVVDGHDLYGDGVNIAARLESVAPAGGILISRAVHEAVDGKLKAALMSVGDLSLKNIERPIAAFQVDWRPDDWRASAWATAPMLALPDKPSIAVLPFHNMTGDPEQDYFADGMVDDITTALSRFKSLFVIARNSSFAYKGKSVDTRQVGRELGVRYVMEGSVRKAGHRVRISGQLVEAASGAQLWADRIDGSLENIFELQDSVTAKVVGAIAQSMDSAETDRAKRKPLENLDAYDCYLRGMACLRDQTQAGTDESLALARRALAFDDDFIPACGLIARCHALRFTQGWMDDYDGDKAEIRRMAGKVVAQGQDNAVALAQAGQAMAYVCHDIDAGRDMIDIALRLNQNLASAWAARAQVSGYYGEHETTLEQAEMALRLSPLDSERHLAEIQMAWANFFLFRYDEAIVWSKRTLSHRPNALAAWFAQIMAMALSGQPEEARTMMKRALQVVPTLNADKIRERAAYRRPEDMEHMMRAFALAGLPD